jgi:hypothetical protein
MLTGWIVAVISFPVLVASRYWSGPVRRSWCCRSTSLDPQVVAELFAARRDPLATLTPREREVLGLMVLTYLRL